MSARALLVLALAVVQAPYVTPCSACTKICELANDAQRAEDACIKANGLKACAGMSAARAKAKQRCFECEFAACPELWPRPRSRAPDL